MPKPHAHTCRFSRGWQVDLEAHHKGPCVCKKCGAVLRGKTWIEKYAALSDLERCMLTELSEQQYGWSPWELWHSAIPNPRIILNRLYLMGHVKVDEAGYYYSLNSTGSGRGKTVSEWSTSQ